MPAKLSGGWALSGDWSQWLRIRPCGGELAVGSEESGGGRRMPSMPCGDWYQKPSQECWGLARRRTLRCWQVASVPPHGAGCVAAAAPAMRRCVRRRHCLECCGHGADVFAVLGLYARYGSPLLAACGVGRRCGDLVGLQFAYHPASVPAGCVVVCLRTVFVQHGVVSGGERVWRFRTMRQISGSVGGWWQRHKARLRQIVVFL